MVILVHTVCYFLVKGQCPIKRHTLKGQGDGIAVLDWSPDDSLLLCCGRDDNPEAIVFSTEVFVRRHANGQYVSGVLYLEWRGEVSSESLL